MSSPGIGKIHCTKVHDKVRLSTLSFSYPLRLLSPRTYSDRHVAAYILTYGGGLLSGDKVDLQVQVDQDCSLSLLSQSSTKVFRQPPLPNPECVPPAPEAIAARQNRRNLTSILTPPPTAAVQDLSATVAAGALLAVLPEPITCFADASYSQHQSFRLAPTSSLVLLDWFTSGRATRGEVWEFDRFMSHNEIYCVAENGQEVEIDLTLQGPKTKVWEDRSYAQNMHPYHCFANLTLIGPRVQALVKSANEAFEKVLITALGIRNSAYGVNRVQNLIFGVGAIPITIGGLTGVTIRAAATETSIMRAFLNERLQGLENEISENLFSRI
ncbi:urease accessory protein UreD [Phlyctochytrium arcticum]|nr:urease accessory protein UreD [Phlyctochytrium arcticum]